MADRGTPLSKMVWWCVWLLLVVVGASPQSNYANRGTDVEYQGNGIPQEAVLDGIVTKLDDLSHTISTNRSVGDMTTTPVGCHDNDCDNIVCRTTASLSCASRAMDVDLEFSEPFFGIIYADFNRHSSCSFVGKGEKSVHYELPLSGCGTLQVRVSCSFISFRSFQAHSLCHLFKKNIG